MEKNLMDILSIIVTFLYFLALGLVYKLIWEYVFMFAKKERKFLPSCLIMILVLFFFSGLIYWTIQYNIPKESTLIYFISNFFTSTKEDLILYLRTSSSPNLHIKIWFFLFFFIAPIGLIIKDTKKKIIRVKHLRKKVYSYKTK